MKKIVSFVKSETVLSVALALALISAFIVPPDAEYIAYIDFRTLSILFCLMTVMAGLQKLGVFEYLAQSMLSRVKTARGRALILVMLCFFMSMLITNDVALITFVPFTFIVLRLSGENDKALIPTVAMQTVAANLGSMLTPIGNPQNMYLYGRAGVTIAEFIRLMLPYTAAAFVMLALWCVIFNGGAKTAVAFSDKAAIKDKRLAALYLALFALCLMSVARAVPYPVTLAVVLAMTAALDRKTLKGVDYSLLLTFVGFFVFIGNAGRIDSFRELLKSVIYGHETLTAAAASQIISNVPAALLLSGFTERTDALIVGTNLGGLGTLIASMASLISFKYIARADKSLRGRYILYFTVVNVIFLAALTALYALLLL